MIIVWPKTAVWNLASSGTVTTYIQFFSKLESPRHFILYVEKCICGIYSCWIKSNTNISNICFSFPAVQTVLHSTSFHEVPACLRSGSRQELHGWGKFYNLPSVVVLLLGMVKTAKKKTMLPIAVIVWCHSYNNLIFVMTICSSAWWVSN